MIIHPYKRGSRGAKRLRDAINNTSSGKKAWLLNREPRMKACLIVNWGASEMSFPEGRHTIINDPLDVYNMSDKVKFFEIVGHDPDFLSWTTKKDEAFEWGREHRVFARQLTRASGGRGIVVWEKGMDIPFPHAPLYTKHQPKTAEYRFHMARSLTGESFHPILVQRKVFVQTPERPAPTDWNVRNHDNGFIFQSHPDMTKVPIKVIEVAQRAMENHFDRLHFCALDILYHKTTDNAVVIEGNTAPGLENGTVEVYANYFRGLDEEYQHDRRYAI